MTNSLQRKLSLIMASVVLVTGLASSILSYELTKKESREFQDDTLRQVAILASSSKGSKQDESMLSDRLSEADGIDPDMHLIVFNQPGNQVPDWVHGDLKAGLQTVKTGRERYRIYVHALPSGMKVIAAQLTNEQDELALQSILQALIPPLLICAVLSWLIIFVIGRELKPVKDLASRLDKLPVAGISSIGDVVLPDEIMPFVHAIQRLFKRVDDALAQQRRFITDAAHELRTPITALSLQMQNVQEASSECIMRKRLEPLQKGIERAQRLTYQLLSLARVQAGQGQITDVNVAELSRDVLAELIEFADDKAIDIGIAPAANPTWRTSREDLRLVIKNGLENAIKYTQTGGEVTVCLAGPDAIIEIVDNGPGIPPAELDRVFDPFYRVPGALDVGSGLGLAIASEAANRLGGIVSLFNRKDAASGLVFRYEQLSQPSAS